ncbi:MAG: hypothetical protein EA372_09485 [Chromatiaceae bacterium]|nr:MAG: hypothetical protein EA372_09485 [Chromatiaceae bacterium]
MTYNESAIKNIAFALCLVFASGMFLAACSDQGPAEEAGEEVDDFVDDTQDSMEELGDEGEEAMEEMQD